ncbi:hypothetical protein LTR85_002680 [Meristemomyces frigidus]|nr:hypothetical protein LTR85_002680 [Meristemomyces frigidus]
MDSPSDRGRRRSGSPDRLLVSNLRDRHDDRDDEDWEDEEGERGESHLPGEPDHTGDEFADTYTKLDHGTKASDAFWSRQYSRVEFTWEQDGKPPTMLGASIKDLINLTRKYKINPRDLPALTVEATDSSELDNLLRCLNVLCAHVHGVKFRREYTKKKYFRTAQDRMSNARVGLLCTGAIKTPKSDSRVTIDDPTRSNGTQGCSSDKWGPFLMTEIKGVDVEIAYTTGFGTYEEPPADRMHQYVYIGHRDAEYMSPKFDIMMVRFEGNNFMNKLSYLQVSNRQTVPLAELPYMIEGELLIEDHKPLANKVRLQRYCGLRRAVDSKNRAIINSLGMDEAAWKARATKMGRRHGLLAHPEPEGTDSERIDTLEEEVARLKAELANRDAAEKERQRQLAEEKTRHSSTMPSTPRSTAEKDNQQDMRGEGQGDGENGHGGDADGGAGGERKDEARDKSDQGGERSGGV